MTSHIQSVILDESCEFTSRKKGTLLLYPQLFPLSYHCTTMFHDSTQHLREFIHIINLPWSMIVALGFGFVSPLSPHSIWDSYNMFYTRLETIWGWFAQYIIPKIYGEVMAVVKICPSDLHQILAKKNWCLYAAMASKSWGKNLLWNKIAWIWELTQPYLKPKTLRSDIVV